LLGAGAGAIGIGLAATAAPSLALGLAVGLVFIVACFVDLTISLAAFTVLIFFERFAGSTGAAKAAGLVLAAAWVLQSLARSERTPLLLRRHPVLASAAVGFVFLGFASSLWAPDPGRAISSAMRLVQVVVLYLIAYSAARDRRRASILTWSFVVGAFCAAATGLVTGQGFAQTDRLSGGILDPNFLAASLVAAVGIGLMLALDPTRDPAARIAVAVVSVVDLLAIFKTESRGGTVALGAVLVVSVLVAGPLRPRALALALVVAALSIGYFAAVASQQARQRVTDFSAQSSAGRNDQWAIARDVAAAHPVLGVGLGNFPVVEAAYTAGDTPLQDVQQILRFQLVVHNSYLEPLAEVGPVGLVALLVAVGGPLLVAVRRLHGVDRPETTVRALVVGLAALLIAYFFLSGEYEKQLWLLAGLTIGAVDASLPERTISA
jgi:O-antigen ligase